MFGENPSMHTIDIVETTSWTMHGAQKHTQWVEAQNAGCKFQYINDLSIIK